MWLRPRLAACLLDTKLLEWLAFLPPVARRTVEAVFAHRASSTSAEERLKALRRAKKRQWNN